MIHATQHKKNASFKGFTLVEVLIAVTVIAILAVITVVAYNGVSRRAVETSLKSDLRSSAGALESEYNKTLSFPATAALANNGQGLEASPGNVLSYQLKPYGFCLTMSNTKTPNTFRIKSSSGYVESGNCDDIVTTLAGSGVSGFNDATGTAAQFNFHENVAVGASGIVYVGDTNNNRVRAIASNGAVSTVAGSVQGSTNANGTSAQFYYPAGVAVDSSGTVYVADRNNHRIRKIAPNGDVTTLAGSSAGFANGTGVAAQFNSPSSVAVDDSGNVYVADSSNNRIRKITSTGVVTTLAGSGTAGASDGTGTGAQFSWPFGVAVDKFGVVYVSDQNNHRIRTISATGVVGTLAGSTVGSANGTGAAAQFNFPSGIAVDTSGTVYVADTSNNRIREITSAGVVTTMAGSTQGYLDGVGSVALFNRPSGVAVNGSGTVYVGDTWNHRIRIIAQ